MFVSLNQSFLPLSSCSQQSAQFASREPSRPLQLSTPSAQFAVFSTVRTKRASTSSLGQGVSFQGRSGSPSPSSASAESLSVMCFWTHSVRVSKCLILPTPLLAPIPLAAEASPAMWAARCRTKSRHKFVRPMTAHPACVKAYHSLSPELSTFGTCVEQIIFKKWLPCVRMLHDA